MCSIGPSHQVYVFQHAFNEADIEAKPFQQELNATKGGLGPATTLATSAIVSDTDGSMARGRMESSGDELSRTATSKNDTRNRRLAVVNKILDEMDDVIVSRRFQLIRKSSVTYAKIRRCGHFSLDFRGAHPPQTEMSNLELALFLQLVFRNTNFS